MKGLEKWLCLQPECEELSLGAQKAQEKLVMTAHIPVTPGLLGRGQANTGSAMVIQDRDVYVYSQCIDELRVQRESLS